MLYSQKMSDDRTLILISVLLFFVPVLSFLNEINLPQILVLDFYLITASQIILLIIVFLSSLIFHKFIFKNLIDFKEFFLLNSLTVYLLFFYKNLKLFFYFLHEKYFLLDDVVVLFIYLFFYIFIIKFEKKYINFLLRFLAIFVILQIVLFSYNFYNFKLNFDNQKFSQKKTSDLTTLNTDLIKKKQNDDTIFFIILDGMISLDLAEKLKIIKSEKKVIQNLKNNNFNYNKNFYNNYDATYLSIASLLQGAYPTIETDKRYRNRDQFFPAFILNQRKDNSFFQILRKTKQQFYWLGNPWAFCQTNIYVKCINKERAYKSLTKIKSFYYDSLLFYLFNFYSHEGKRIDYINFVMNFDRKFEKNEVYLIHVLNPHPPYVFDKDCNILDKIIVDKPSASDAMAHYSNAYNCLLDIINKLSGKIDSVSKNNMVFVLGDHGWSFDNEIMEEYNLDPEETRFKPFFSYKVPTRCNKIKAPGSIVNIMRYALICKGNTEFKYLEDIKFKTFYESQPENFGKVFRIN